MSNRNGRALMLALGAGVSLLALAPAAYAQDTEPAVEQVVVTATRRAESLQDVPMSVNVVTGEQLERLQILDVKDVQQLAPGLELSNTTGRNNTATLRGINFDPDQGTSPAVDLYFNEVIIDAQTAFTAIYDVQQIEVLRGPQGALRGRTSPAGAITIRTRRPGMGGFEGNVQATATDNHGYNVQGGVTVPLIADKLALRVAGLVDGNRLNDVYNITRDETSHSRTQSGRLSLEWRPTDNFDLNVMYQYLHADNRQMQQVFGPGNAAVGNAPIALSDRLAVHEGIWSNENTSDLITMEANWDLGPVTLSFVGGHQESQLEQSSEGDSGNAIHNYAPTQFTSSPYDVDTAELRIVSNNDGFWNWSLGAFYSKQTGDVRVLQPVDFVGGIAGVPTPAIIVPLTGSLFIPVLAKTMAISASSRFEFTDKLTFEVAARYSDILGKQVATLTLPLAPPLVLPLVNETINSYPITGAATLTYEFTPTFTAYAAYGRSFRGATAGVGVPQNVSSDLEVSGSERTDSYEIGFKTALFDRRLSLEVAAFYQEFDGFIARFNGIPTDQGTNIDVTGDGVPDGVFVGPPDGNVDTSSGYQYNGDAEVKGIEATLSGRPTENWDFSVSAAFAEARYKNALLPCTTLDPVTGNPVVIPNPAFGGLNNVSFCARNSSLSDVPDFSLTANSELRFPMDGDLEPFVRGLFSWRPGVFSENSLFHYPSRELLNLFVGVRNREQNWEVTIFARNLLDDDAITNISAANAQVTGTSVFGPTNPVYNSGYRLVNTTTPREIGITTSLRF